MKKPSVSKKATTPAKTKPDGLSTLLTEVRQLIQSARRSVSTVVDTFQVMTNFEIGRRIVEHEQKGAKRAAYGAELLKELSARLTEEFGRGFSPVNLSHMRRFFLVWQERVQIFQQPTEKLATTDKPQTPSGQLAILQQPAEKLPASEISQPPIGKLGSEAISQQPVAKSGGSKTFQQPTGKSTALQKGQSATDQFAIFQSPSGKSRCPFTLSWTHYVLLLTIKDPDERSFYEIEATNAGWSVPELKRQKSSCLYERLALSRDKEGIRRLAKEGQLIVKPEDLLKEPLVLEFLGLDAHQYYDREVKLPDENPTIGLLLCKSAKKTVVELTLPKDANIHAKEPERSGDRLPQAARRASLASQYQLYLPSKELLKQKLDEWSTTSSR